ncbi:MAG: hypothetical protein HC836_16025 [Richelia sp. RM2_1_2]|uniref:Uncharacterized protein n=1 Tax=Plectonema cf. radiosum LEGE 06105 TaxID=945769 RepID=A0A8J7FH18_9CYAN|nr:hypothetical protein [Plectonema radiosum]MBE9213641.1 hypothetical protein [Plectonema cf. radiosum LEGE 06105]NJN11066.1 hypothetical protein [Richelia sp. RM1_1_1]NJO59749.1 hypothetical protein [Richelia sp. RM2_1_2]
MAKTSILNSFIQHLESLSLRELLLVKQKVDELIQKKTFSPYRTTINSQQYPSNLQGQFTETYYINTYIGLESEFTSVQPVTSLSTTLTKIKKHQEYDEVKNESEVKDNSLENAINLVDEWMTDESGYDEEVYPEIENALKKNRASF